jgi:hypothetical protein
MISKRQLLLTGGAILSSGAAAAQSPQDFGLVLMGNDIGGDTYTNLLDAFRQGVAVSPDAFEHQMNRLGGIEEIEGLAEFYINRYPVFDFETILNYDPNLADLLGGIPNFASEDSDGPSYTKGPDFDKEPYDRRPDYDKMGFNRTF